MTTVQDIESASERQDDLPLGQLSGWFEDYLAEKWENRFATDAQTVRLDKLGGAADRAFQQGQCRPL